MRPIKSSQRVTCAVAFRLEGLKYISKIYEGVATVGEGREDVNITHSVMIGCEY